MKSCLLSKMKRVFNLQDIVSLLYESDTTPSARGTIVVDNMDTLSARQITISVTYISATLLARLERFLFSFKFYLERILRAPYFAP